MCPGAMPGGDGRPDRAVRVHKVRVAPPPAALTAGPKALTAALPGILPGPRCAEEQCQAVGITLPGRCRGSSPALVARRTCCPRSPSASRRGVAGDPPRPSLRGRLDAVEPGHHRQALPGILPGPRCAFPAAGVQQLEQQALPGILPGPRCAVLCVPVRAAGRRGGVAGDPPRPSLRVLQTAHRGGRWRVALPGSSPASLRDVLGHLGREQELGGVAGILPGPRGTRAWNKSFWPGPPNTSLGSRHRRGMLSASGCTVAANPGPDVRGSPSFWYFGWPIALSRRAMARA